MTWYQIQNDVAVLNLKIQPKAKQTAFLETLDTVKKIAVKAPPQDGEANTALIKFLADFFKLTQKEINLVRGHTSRLKVIKIPCTVYVKERLTTL